MARSRARTTTKKKKKTRKGPAKGGSPAKKAAARRRALARKKAKASGKRPAPKRASRAGRAVAVLEPIHALSASRRASVFRAVNNTLREQGVRGRVTALHTTTPLPRDRDLVPRCPPGQVRRMVCKKQNGVVVCTPECQDF